MMSATLGQVKAIIFDVGGVFRDSSTLMHLSFVTAFSRHNLPLKLDREQMWHLRGLESFNDLSHAIRALIVTKGEGLSELLDDEEQLNYMIKKSDIDENVVKSISDSFKSVFSAAEHKDKVILLPRSEETLQLLKARGYQLGVLSNSTMKALERDIGHLFSYFHFTISDAEKPNTSKYLSALKSLGISPKEAAYVGDAVSDITLAKRAGSTSVALLSGMGLEKHLRAATPDLVFNTVYDFAVHATQNQL